MRISCFVALFMFVPLFVQAQVTGALYDRAIDRSQKGDYYGAISDFTRVIELYPSESKPFHYRGLCKFNLRDFSGAILDFTKAIELNPRFADALYMRGMAKVGAKDKKAACVDFQRATNMGHQGAATAAMKYCN